MSKWIVLIRVIFAENRYTLRFKEKIICKREFRIQVVFDFQELELMLQEVGQLIVGYWIFKVFMDIRSRSDKFICQRKQK